MASASQSGNPNPAAKNVAVIAVHGVGHTESGATAKHLADLLLGLGRYRLDETTAWPPASGPVYDGFTQRPIVVPLKRPYIADENRTDAQARVAGAHPGMAKRVLHGYDERLGYLAKAFAGEIPPPEVEAQVAGDTGKIAHEFMRAQLAAYVGEEEGRAFDTVCLEGERQQKDQPATGIHIYESYWADLARPQNSFFSFLMAFYQLLFHLSSLSRTAVYYATLEHMGQKRWRAVSFLQAFASRMLVLPIPILNLILLLTGLTVLPLKLTISHRILAISVSSLLALVSVLYIKGLHALPQRPWQWRLLLGIAAAVGFGAGFGLTSWRDSSDLVIALEWWVVGGLLFALLLQSYEKVRRRAFATGIALLVLSFVAFCYCVFKASDARHPIEQASFWTIQLVMGVLIICWAALLLSSLALWICNGLCLYGKRARSLAPDVRGRARAALRTGRLTLAVSASIFLVATIFLWAGVFNFATTRLKLYAELHPTPPPIGQTLNSAFSYLVPDPETTCRWIQIRVESPAANPDLCSPSGMNQDPQAFNKYVRALLLIAVTSGLPLMLAMSAPVLIILIWMVLPSLLAKRHKLHTATNAQCTRMGNWFSHGLDSSTVMTTLLWHSIFSVTLIFGFLDFLYCHGFDAYFPLPKLWWLLQKNTVFTLRMLDVAAGTLAVSGAAIATLLFKYGKAPLDIILDVDNYLRTSPLETTPRARIAERYVSLLRYIANRKDAEGKPFYQSIVIGAHSLGSLISADLLHFLNREGDPDLSALGFWPITSTETPAIGASLLTFGNPLRQLLTRFFPHLYWWVNPIPDNSLKPLPLGTDNHAKVTQAATPDLHELRLDRWVNAYRSGDFVGRALWLDNWYNRNSNGPTKGQYSEPALVFPIKNQQAQELCVGLGGHNDYWDRSAPDIAEQLDALIR